MALIEIRELEKIYRAEEVETRALQSVSFSIAKGEFVAIMGPSGSGKSTLLHILGFLDRQTSGEYFFNGRAIGEYNDNALARVRNEKMGFVFQSFNLLPRMSVFDNVKLTLLYSALKESEWEARARAAIQSVGLSHRIDHEPSQLSGGERQRAAIARALVNRPEIVFADEPTGNLDTESGDNIMAAIQDLNKNQGHTIVLITHEDHIAKYAKRIIRLRDGRLEADETLKDSISRPTETATP